ncbi:MAG TPA: diacylglycerol kinase family protein, partial [Candidatus Omnitrophota bacterium]|nr:diacylglycerol kinase family protein [Candidatus Omnitrophota bacterium]
MKRALLVVNRKSRSGGADLSAIVERLAEGGVATVERDCADPVELSPLIAAEGRAMDLVIVGGGDGTLNRALEGLVAADRPLGL